MGVAVGAVVGVGVATGVPVGVAVGVGVGPAAAEKHAENSDVLFAGSVAVAVTTVSPGGIANAGVVKLALHVASVVTSMNPRNVRPWPKPDAPQAEFEKNSRRYVVLAMLFSVPEIVTLPPAMGADVMTG